MLHQCNYFHKGQFPMSHWLSVGFNSFLRTKGLPHLHIAGHFGVHDLSCVVTCFNVSAKCLFGARM